MKTESHLVPDDSEVIAPAQIPTSQNMPRGKTAAKDRVARPTTLMTVAPTLSPTVATMAEDVVAASNRALKKFRKAACTSLVPHVDSDMQTYRRGQLLAIPTERQGSAGFVIVPKTFGPSATKFSKGLSPEKIPAYVRGARRVPAPAGSYILWHPRAVHANCGHGNTLPAMDPGPITVTLKDALTNPDAIHAIVDECGVCVVTGILSQKECDKLVNDAANALLESRTDPHARGVKPKGFSGCSLVKNFGISVNPAVMRWMVHSNVRDLWTALLGTPDICFSPDALAVSLNPDLEYNPHHPTRVALILCYGRNKDQVPGTGAKKLDRILNGKQCNHNPVQCIPGGGGDHMSNRKVPHPISGVLETPWKEQIWPKDAYSTDILQYLGQ